MNLTQVVSFLSDLSWLTQVLSNCLDLIKFVCSPKSDDLLSLTSSKSKSKSSSSSDVVTAFPKRGNKFSIV